MTAEEKEKRRLRGRDRYRKYHPGSKHYASLYKAVNVSTGEEKIFDNQNGLILFFDCSITKIKLHIKNKTVLNGYRIENFYD